MKFDSPANSNYAAVVVRVSHLMELAGLDNLVGVPVLGHTALTQRGKSVGDLAIAFTAETALSDEFAAHNNLFRDSTLNADQSETGYLERNGRIRAIKLRGHKSNALLMPLSAVEYTGVNWGELREGDTFDTLNGHEICRKYEVPVKPGSTPAASKVEKAFKRVDHRTFPEHLDTDNYWRCKHLLTPGREAIVTQKLHGTSIRIGNVPVLRQLSRRERFAKRWLKANVADYEFDVVYGSRKVIKDINNAQSGYYQSDIWTKYGQQIAELIPEGYMVYGELVGFTPEGGAIQKNYGYEAGPGQAHLYVYRVAHVNRHGHMADLSWDGVKLWCQARGLSTVPELWRVEPGSSLDDEVDALMDERFADIHAYHGFVDRPVQLSHPKTVDEGVCIRQDGVVPTILKAKSPVFLEHETKLLDAGEADLESVESAEAIAA